MAMPQQRFLSRIPRGIDDERLQILVIGGSLGASALNQGLPKLFDEASRRGVKLSIRHQTGANDLDRVKAQYAELGLAADCFAFIDDMQSAYEWSDLLVCRAGASTVTEVAAAGLAAVFIPLPSAIDDHQTANARYLADQHAAWLVPQSALATNSLADLLQGLSREDLQQVAERAKSLSISNAAQTVAQHAIRLAGHSLTAESRADLTTTERDA